MITDKLINLHRFGSVDIIGYKFFIKQKEHSESMKECVRALCILLKRTCEVNTMRENSSFIFTCYVKTFPVYDFKLLWVVLHPSDKEFFKTAY